MPQQRSATTESGKDLPLVSAVITTCNRGERVEKAVASALEQDYPRQEILVIDDGSTDDTAERLSRFRDRIHYVYQKRNGVSSARNTGIRLSHGRYIAFLDSDDIWKPDKTSKQVRFLEANASLRICQTEEIWIRHLRRVNPKKIHRKPSGWIFKESLRLCCVSPSSVMIREDLFEEIGLFKESFPACEDYDLWLRISCREPILLIPEHLVVKFGGHADQLSRTVPCLDKYRIQAIAELLEKGALNGEQRRLAVEELMRKCKIVSDGCVKRGKVEEGEYYQEIARRAKSNVMPGKEE
jgi:glycosyltransferase involved in cell wall biosynthesis